MFIKFCAGLHVSASGTSQLQFAASIITVLAIPEGGRSWDGQGGMDAAQLAGRPGHGAVDLEEEERKRQGERYAAFQGSGFRLGDCEGPSTNVVLLSQPLTPAGGV